MMNLQPGQSMFTLSSVVSKSVNVFCCIAYLFIALAISIATTYLFFYSDETMPVVLFAWFLCVMIFVSFERIFWFLFVRRFPMSIDAYGELAVVRYAFGVRRTVRLDAVRIVDNGVFVTIDGLSYFWVSREVCGSHGNCRVEIQAT